MQLSPARFNNFLKGIGQAVSWRRSDLCPCRNPVSGSAAQGCPACQGRGVIWDIGVPAWTGVAGMKVAREWAQFGQWESGDAVFTIPSDSPLYQAGENDRVVMLNSTEPFRAILTRGESDRLTPAVTEIDRLFWLVGADTINGGIPTVQADGSLVWADDNLPPPDEMQYSVTGRRHPEYYVFQNLPQDRAHFSGATLPRRVAMRRFDLFGR